MLGISYFLVGHTVIYYVLVVTYTGNTRALVTRNRNIDFSLSKPFQFQFPESYIIVIKRTSPSFASFCSQISTSTAAYQQVSFFFTAFLWIEFVSVLFDSYIFPYCNTVRDEGCIFLILFFFCWEFSRYLLRGF